MTIRLKSLTTVFALATVCALFAAPANAQWATLKGKFKFNGDIPAPVVLDCAKEPMCCADKKPVDQTLVISKDKELANVFVYARTKVTKINPALKANLKPLELDNKNCTFTPHAAILWTEQKLVLKNSDMVGHNTNYGSALQGFNVLISANSSTEKDLKASENLPQDISCNIHPWMKAKLLVRDNPYFAVSAADGTFEIKDVPSGEEIEYVMWHEKVGYLPAIKFNGGVTDAKGRFKIKAAKDMDLGEITVDAKVLSK